MGIQFITDSGSDMTNGFHPDLTVIPLKINFDDAEYLDGVTLSHQEFYEKLIECDTLPKTSQVAPFEFEEAIKKIHEAGDVAIIITLSSKLSGTHQSACIAASEFDSGVYVIDSENVALGERILVERGLQLKDAGMEADKIAETLNDIKRNVRIIALLDTLEYLKKGGRISKTVAFAGNILNIKPVIAVVDGVVELLGKARGSKQGNNLLMELIHTSGGIDFSMPFCLGYTGLSDALIKKYAADSANVWENEVDTLPIVTIGGTIGTHVGPGAIAVAFYSNK